MNSPKQIKFIPQKLIKPQLDDYRVGMNIALNTEFSQNRYETSFFLREIFDIRSLQDDEIYQLVYPERTLEKWTLSNIS